LTDTLRDWLGRYGAAWESLDSAAAASLFTDDARYHETPFADPFVGKEGVREYWERVTADQSDVDFTYEVVGMLGDKGVALWNTKLTALSTGSRVELDGVFVLELEGDLCRVLREWWHVR
jgi:ketosteroid isomerase-like protein